MHPREPAPASGPTAHGVLNWDGRRWWLAQAGAQWAGWPEVVWDLDRALALRWHGPGARWLWMLRRRDPAGWHALRVALMHAATP